MYFPSVRIGRKAFKHLLEKRRVWVLIPYQLGNSTVIAYYVPYSTRHRGRGTKKISILAYVTDYIYPVYPDTLKRILPETGYAFIKELYGAYHIGQYIVLQDMHAYKLTPALKTEQWNGFRWCEECKLMVLPYSEYCPICKWRGSNGAL